jgi:hypothetical protein
LKDSLQNTLSQAKALRYSDPVSALEKAQWALASAQEMKLPFQEASAHKILARLYAKQGNYVSAVPIQWKRCITFLVK